MIKAIKIINKKVMKSLIKNRINRKVLFGVILIIISVLMLFKTFGGSVDNAKTIPSKKIITVETKSVLSETVKQFVSLSAITESFNKVEIFSEINGEILDFYCFEGNYVKKGQTLINLKTDQSLLANFENAKTNLKIVKESLENTEKLQKQLKEDAEGTSSEDSVRKSARLAIDIAKGQVKIAKGQIDYIQSQLDKYTIQAPASGIISQIDLDKGDLAMVTIPIMTISDNQKIKVELALTEFDINKIFVEQEVEINLAAYPDDKFIGKVYYVSSAADPISKKFPVKIQLENTDKKIKAGMIADAKIIVNQQKDILVIPRSAIFEENGVEKVYLVEDSRIKIKTIKTEAVTESKLKVLEGLSVGDEVVASGNYTFKDNDLITVK